ncbi:hypothetical protein CKF59_01360 [Psittacicella gerlachiana]|uniref:Uncharacterized protein n=1 Tax=Psittacicella gerlachiana TaxID=2028574 RepID=A0A3A1YJL4_9GAMM|nr:hypothetical protein CKF59_01360 [Psittacicella gerlachiana]
MEKLKTLTKKEKSGKSFLRVAYILQKNSFLVVVFLGERKRSEFFYSDSLCFITFDKLKIVN